MGNKLINKKLKKHYLTPPQPPAWNQDLLERIMRASEQIARSSRTGGAEWVIHTGTEGLTMFNESFDIDTNTGQPAVYGPGSNPNYFNDILGETTITDSLWGTLSANTQVYTSW